MPVYVSIVRVYAVFGTISQESKGLTYLGYIRPYVRDSGSTRHVFPSLT